MPRHRRGDRRQPRAAALTDVPGQEAQQGHSPATLLGPLFATARPLTSLATSCHSDSGSKQRATTPYSPHSTRSGQSSLWPAAHDVRWEALHGHPPAPGDALLAQAAERLRRANA